MDTKKLRQKILNCMVLTVICSQMMEKINTSEMSVNFYQTTRRNIPQDCHFLLILIGLWMQFLFVTVVSQYLTSAKFSKDLFATIS
jgi:hypothetical protein